ncbi:MAG: hypothetical protein JW757_03345 [Anaerolineales bacterium]|nr:hypothetical protein [Anaerolineales bacterium]
MTDAIRFFQQYESAVYFVLAIGIVVFGWRFYKAWQEMRGSVFGLEQVGAQRRLNQSAVAIFMIILMGVGVFSLVTFAQPIIDSEAIPEALAELGIGADLVGAGGDEGENNAEPLATATPLPTVEVDPTLCDPERINITSPVVNEEVRGTVEIIGVVNVNNFGFYMVEWARADAALWTTIQTNRNLVPEEGVLLEWDTSLFSPGSYVIQLVVTDTDGQEYPPCRIPLQIGSQ